MAKQFFYKFGDDTIGPLNSQQLRDAAARGAVQQDTLIQVEEGGPTVPAYKLRGLFDETGAPVARPSKPPMDPAGGNESSRDTENQSALFAKPSAFVFGVVCVVVVFGLIWSLGTPHSARPKIPSAINNSENKVAVAQKNSIGMTFVKIPAGEFLMEEAISNNADQKQVQKTLIKIDNSFFMSACEVTQSNYRKVMGVNPSFFQQRRSRSDRNEEGMDEFAKLIKKIAQEGSVEGLTWGPFPNNSGMNTDNIDYGDTYSWPVERVSWQDAVSFCERLSKKEGKRYRLPTEAEWEYACRAGTTSAYHFGNSESFSKAINMYEWWWGNSGERPHPVGRRQSNHWGLYDMHGNVREWCLDQKVLGQRNDQRVVRGGMFHQADPTEFQSSARSVVFKETRDFGIGFRIVRE